MRGGVKVERKREEGQGPLTQDVGGMLRNAHMHLAVLQYSLSCQNYASQPYCALLALFQSPSYSETRFKGKNILKLICLSWWPTYFLDYSLSLHLYHRFYSLAQVCHAKTEYLKPNVCLKRSASSCLCLTMSHLLVYLTYVYQKKWVSAWVNHK